MSTLTRQLTFAPLFFVIVANVIGTGIFTTSGFVLADVGDGTTMLLCWLVGGLLALGGSLCYAELGAMFPMAGGDYVFVRESFGQRLAFLSGWISLWVGFSAPIAASGIAFGSYLNRGLPPDLRGALSPTALAVVAIAGLTAVHLRGVAFGVRVQGLLSFLKIFVILVFIVAGFAFGEGSFGHFSRPGSPSSVLSGGFATSLIFISFAYSGWNAAAYLGGEVREPGKTYRSRSSWGPRSWSSSISRSTRALSTPFPRQR